MFPALRDNSSRATGSRHAFCPAKVGFAFGELPSVGSSRNLSRFAGLLNFCSCTQDSFVMVVAPGYAHLHAIKILYLDIPIAIGTARCLRRVTQHLRGRLAPSLKQLTGLFLFARYYCRAVRFHSFEKLHYIII